MMENRDYKVKRTTEVNALPQPIGCMNFFSRLIFQHTKANVWVAGGAVRDYLDGGKLTSDIDVFGPDEKELKKCMSDLHRAGFTIHYQNNRVVKGTMKDRKIDIVLRPFATPEETIDNFDFTICCFAVSKTGFFYHPSAPFDLIRKRLVINNLPYPVSTFQRLQKFLKRGYWICNGGMLEITKALSQVDMNDPDQNNIEFYPDGEARIVGLD